MAQIQQQSSSALPATSESAANYARPAFVILSGVISTMLMLMGVWYSQQNIMGWYADYVIPVGALLVGLVAGSGYGIASYFTGLKIRAGLLAAILGLQGIAYFAAQYIEFRDAAPIKLVDSGGVAMQTREGATVQIAPMGFWEYFHQNAINFAWKDKLTGKPGEPLGMWGYFFRMLEIAGFVVGGILAPLILYNKAYCEPCQMYMTNKSMALLPASLPPKKFKKSEAKAAAYQQQLAQIVSDSKARLKELLTAATTGDSMAFRILSEDVRKARRATSKLPSRIDVTLVRCKNCATGYLRSTMLTGQGKKINKTEMSRTQLSPEFVQGIVARDQ